MRVGTRVGEVSHSDPLRSKPARAQTQTQTRSLYLISMPLSSRVASASSSHFRKRFTPSHLLRSGLPTTSPKILDSCLDKTTFKMMLHQLKRLPTTTTTTSPTTLTHATRSSSLPSLDLIIHFAGFPSSCAI